MLNVLSATLLLQRVDDGRCGTLRKNHCGQRSGDQCGVVFVDGTQSGGGTTAALTKNLKNNTSVVFCLSDSAASKCFCRYEFGTCEHALSDGLLQSRHGVGLDDGPDRARLDIAHLAEEALLASRNAKTLLVAKSGYGKGHGEARVGSIRECLSGNLALQLYMSTTWRDTPGFLEGFNKPL